MPLDQFSPQHLTSSIPKDEGAADRKPASKGTKMQYILTGFTHDLGSRVFAFESIGEDRIRTAYSVRADLALTRKYGIRMQELPLLCRNVLEQRDGDDAQRTFTYTEAAMCLRANIRAAEAAEQKKKTPRRPPSENVGNAWRGPRV
jgi:hypothetical protein